MVCEYESHIFHRGECCVNVHCCHIGTAIAQPCVRVPRCPKLQLNMVWHMMLYSCTHMATVGVKGLKKEASVSSKALSALCMS